MLDSMTNDFKLDGYFKEVIGLCDEYEGKKDLPLDEYVDWLDFESWAPA